MTTRIDPAYMGRKDCDTQIAEGAEPSTLFGPGVPGADWALVAAMGRGWVIHAAGGGAFSDAAWENLGLPWCTAYAEAHAARARQRVAERDHDVWRMGFSMGHDMYATLRQWPMGAAPEQYTSRGGVRAIEMAAGAPWGLIRDAWLRGFEHGYAAGHTGRAVTAHYARPSIMVDTAGAVDVGIAVATSGRVTHGVVTLCPRPADGRLDMWGESADAWVSALLLRQIPADPRLLDQIAAEARACAEECSP